MTKAEAKTVAENIKTMLSKGTLFAGFDYKDKRRNVVIGANLAPYCSGGENKWGTTSKETKGSIVEYDGNFYLQAVENNIETRKIKRFNIEKMSNLVVG
jgi:hypothetical protein